MATNNIDCWHAMLLLLLTVFPGFAMALVLQQQEAEALMAFKAQITGDPESCLASWNYNPSSNVSINAQLCSWQGISCDTNSRSISTISKAYNQSHVVGLNLTKCYLSGTISPFLGSLPALSILDLSNNNLSGYLEASIFSPNCPLEYIDISYNILHGSIPSSLPRNCKQLQVLHLLETGLIGPIPSGIWSELPHLVDLQIQGDASLTLPSFPPTLAFCSIVKRLFLKNFNASGASFPQSLASCRYLQILYINVVGLKGIILDGIWQLPVLEKLVIADAEVIGFIDTTPSGPNVPRPYGLHAGPFKNDTEFGFCHTIQSMSIDGINLTGQIPPSLGRCISLKRLDLSHSSLQGPIPASLGNLTNLQILYLEANNLTQGIPSALSSCSQLQDLRLGFNPLSGSIPKELGELSQLHFFSAYTANLGGTVPSEICNCTQLWWFDVGWQKELFSNLPDHDLTNGITGGIPECFGTHLKNLQTLSWTSNPIQGEIPTGILVNLTNLNDLELSRCQLSGFIPQELAVLTNMQALDLSMNDLQGNIPMDAFQLMIGLQTLRLYDNNLTGSIKHFDISKMLYLETFVVHNNALSGGLPPTLTQSETLVTFDVSHNQLQGEILDTTSVGLSKLRLLFLGYNQLNGMIPRWIWRLSKLQGLDLSNNHFNGSLPTKFDLPCYMNLNQNPCVSLFPIYENVVITLGNAYTLRYITSTRIYVDVSMNLLEGTIPQGFGELQVVIGINLSHNNIHGPIPQTFGKLKVLEILDLSYNQVSGHIPQELTSLSLMSTLNLSNNKLEGMIPIENGFNTRFNPWSFQGNLDLCGYPLSIPCNNNRNKNVSRSSPPSRISVIVTLVSNIFAPWGIFVGYVVGLLVGFYGYYFCRFRHMV